MNGLPVRLTESPLCDALDDGSSINSTAITSTLNGRQYVSIASGLGGELANRYAGEKVPAGGSMWTFALMTD